MVTSKTAGGSIKITKEHSAGIGQLIKTNTTAHYSRQFRHRHSLINFHHIINIQSRQESMYYSTAVNGTGNKITNLGGLPSKHPGMLLPTKFVTTVSSAMKTENGTSTQRRESGTEIETDIAKKIVQEICDYECPSCVSNAVNALSSCWDVANPDGDCCGIATNCAVAIASEGADIVSDGMCLWDGYNCFESVKECYESIEKTYDSCKYAAGYGEKQCSGYSIIGGSQHWKTCWHEDMHDCHGRQYCCCETQYKYSTSRGACEPCDEYGYGND